MLVCLLLYDILLVRNSQVALDLSLVNAIDGDPSKVASNDQTPQGVSSGHVWIKTRNGKGLDLFTP